MYFIAKTIKLIRNSLMSSDSRLNRAFKNAMNLPLSASTKYVLMSDCHRGIGSTNDNFLKNQHLCFAALKHYYQNHFTYIELGDGLQKTIASELHYLY